MSAFAPDAWLQGDADEREEEVEVVDLDSPGTVRVRHADGHESLQASYLILPFSKED